MSIQSISKICDGETNEFYAQHVAELSKKMKLYKILQTQDIRALKEVGPELEKLRIKVG
jgi:hypothetical protein